MPTFSQIELFLDEGYSREENKSLIFKSRCICNYVERALRERKYQTALSRINIFCSKEINEARVARLREPPLLEVFIKYDLPISSELSESSLQTHFMRIIDLGLVAAENSMPVPREYCMSVLQKFESEGFKNEWVQTRKSWKKWAIRCDVVARLTIENFTLQQFVYRDELLIEKKLIAETKPREMLFYDYFGTLSLDQSGVIVYKNKEKVLTRFSIDANEFCDTNFPGS